MGEFGIIAITIAVLGVAAACIYAVARFRPRLYVDKGNFSERKGKVEFVVPSEGTPYLLKRNPDGTVSDEPFKILSCADTHIRTENSELTFTLLSRFLDREKPDLVILVGDNVVGRTDTIMHEKLKSFFEERKQFFGFVLGNHDSEKLISEEFSKTEGLTDEEKEKITLRLRKKSFDALSGGGHCIVRDESCYGSGNCVVNIKNSKGVSQSIFFFDSGDYVYGRKRKGIGSEKRCYGYIHNEQIKWYQRRLSEITAENGGILPKSMVFFHIPLAEYRTAFKAGFWKRKSARIIFGTNYEKPCTSDINDGAFEAFLREGSTKILVCGHDHKNDSSVLYKGIRLMYSQGLQYDKAYNRRKKSHFLKLLNNVSDSFCCFTEGVSLFMVNVDGTVDVAAKYAQKEKLFYGLERYYESGWLDGTIKKEKPKS